MSQLDLALASGVSQRHISFLESARANPSRTMILQLGETLEVPLRDRHRWLNAAGFAPVFKTRMLDDPQMAQIMNAIGMMLSAHEPFPAIALNRAWNVLMSNRPFDLLGSMLGDDIWERVGGGQRNMMRLFFHPAGIRQYVTNWSAVGPLVWQRARREAEALGGSELRAVLDNLADFQEPDILWSAVDVALVPVMPFDITVGDRKIAVFAMVATFGTPQDVTAEELRIEMLFPADAATEVLFRSASLKDVDNPASSSG